MSFSNGEITILVIENNSADACLMKEALASAGITSGVHYVSDGEEALAHLDRQTEDRSLILPDLIFLDLHLPKLSGLELLHKLKSTPEFTHIPVVVISGSEDPEMVRSVYTAGGNCFIGKPIDLDDFIRFIQQCILFWGSVATLSPRVQQAGSA